MKIVVMGGTGLIGSKLVARLTVQGYEVVAASRRSGVNTVTVEGLAAVLQGASVVIDASNSPSFEDRAAKELFSTGTRNLLAAEATAGAGHHVALSVVGAERLPHNSYFGAKFAQEQLIKASPIPYSIVRSTQFFEFVKGIADAATEGNTVGLAPVLFKPIAADDVVSAVGRITVGAPLNGTIDIGGPEPFRFDALVRRGLHARNDPREVIADPRALYFGDVPGERTLVPGDGALLFETRFEDWLRQPVLQK